jgi:DMSO/TMAO reductase YedYZ molybdopterin-dependent catalytic subunit
MMNNFKKHHSLDGNAIVNMALDELQMPARRKFMTRSLSLGGLSLLSGCSLTDENSVERMLMGFSRFNDKVQAWLFDPNRLAPTYPESMITRLFPFNAFYGRDKIPVVEPDSYRLEIAGW